MAPRVPPHPLRQSTAPGHDGARWGAPGGAGYIAGKKGRVQYANRILPTLTDPDEVWQVAFDDGTFRNRYIKLYDDPGTGGSLCIVSKLPDGQEVLINYIPMNDLPEDDTDACIDVQRAGSLLFRRG